MIVDPLLVTDVEVDGRLVDVLLADGVIRSVTPATAPAAERAALRRAATMHIDASGGGLIPGLHDHHVHLAALAAARTSLRLGPPTVADSAGLDRDLRDAHQRTPAGEWIRATGYHESVAGPLDRDRLDGLAPGRAVRVQHSSGAMWVLSSTACEVVGLRDHGDGEPPAHGVERDLAGRPTGRLFGLDAWLGERVPHAPLDLAGAAALLNRYGVTGITDTTAATTARPMALLRDAVADGLPLRVTATGGSELAERTWEPLGLGPVKVVVADHELPALDELVDRFSAARRAGRAVAVHCVTRVALVLALAAWDQVGSVPGDRIEHGAVVPPELARRVARHAVTVVTQPNFVAERGDRYRREVDADDLPWLYRCRGLLDGGIPVGLGTDAPFGHPDPWRAIAAAAERRTPAGDLLGPDERIPAGRALAMFLARPATPGGPPRHVEAGSPADLCLLDAPLSAVLVAPSAEHVVLTISAGHVVFDRDEEELIVE